MLADHTMRYVSILLLSGTFGVSAICRQPVRLFRSSQVLNAAKRAVDPGHVYFVATPLGNLGDMTSRAIDVLSEVDVICAEDTRHTLKLLRHFEIPMKPLISHHEHNWSEQVPNLVNMALSGKSLAVVSDAGTPGISDPGKELAAACALKNIPLHPIPGASAVVAALSVSGFSGSEFTFKGFFPVKGKERTARLSETAATTHTVVFFEAPHRMLQTLRELETQHGQGNRQCVCCREITKLHEEFKWGTVSMCRRWLENKGGGGDSNSSNNDENENDDDGDDTQDQKQQQQMDRGGIRGEFTVVLGPMEAADIKVDPQLLTMEQLSQLREDGVSRSEAVRLVVEMTGVAKGKVYKQALDMDWQ